ncbi:MAG: hypothetical protein ACYTEL_27115 [Planctomycetota bacterium]
MSPNQRQHKREDGDLNVYAGGGSSSTAILAVHGPQARATK